MDLKNFERNPLLMKLIKNYISIQYQENADYSTASMLAEVNSLIKENQLHQLFEAEYVANYPRE